MNVAEFIISYLEKKQVNHVFTLSGGGIMYLTEALGRSEKIKYVCNYHEQACAISADSYGRINEIGVALVTFGPGAVNALAGAVGSWYDSVPTVVICGQVKTELIADYSVVRQLGPQEGNVMAMVEPVTKYSVQLTDPNTVEEELDKAFSIAVSGRPGPVWIEVPLDVQAAEMPVGTDHIGSNIALTNASNTNQIKERTAFVETVLSSLKTASRPVLLVGNGIALSNTRAELIKLAETLGIPVLVPYTARDVYCNDQDHFYGVFGTAGQRHSNIILQNSDLILSLGVGLSVSKTGYAVDKFAPNALKIGVDIDAAQLHAHSLTLDHTLEDDLRDFIPHLQGAGFHAGDQFSDWIDLCKTWQDSYPVFVEKPLDENYVDAYRFIDELSAHLTENEVIVTGNGLDCVSFYQGFKSKQGQRAILNGNWGSMGWDIPTAIGAHYATGNRVICIAGDGGMLLNSQELLGIGANKLPIKVFVYNNEGYGSIKATQKGFFDGHFVSSEPSSGVYNPDFEFLAKAYGMSYSKVDSDMSLQSCLEQSLNNMTPELIELKIDPDQWIAPKASAFRNSEGQIESKPLDDMSPFLDPQEVDNNRDLALSIKKS